MNHKDSNSITRSDLDEALSKFATKEDLKQFATKEDLKQFATKKDLEQFATKKDLKQYPTKKYLDRKLSKYALAWQVESLDNDFGRFVKFVQGQFVIINKQFAYQNKLLEKLVGEKADENQKLDNHETRIGYLEDIVLPSNP